MIRLFSSPLFHLKTEAVAFFERLQIFCPEATGLFQNINQGCYQYLVFIIILIIKVNKQSTLSRTRRRLIFIQIVPLHGCYFFGLYSSLHQAGQYKNIIKEDIMKSKVPVFNDIFRASKRLRTATYTTLTTLGPHPHIIISEDTARCLRTPCSVSRTECCPQ